MVHPLIEWNSVEAKVSFPQPLWIKLGFDPSALDFLVLACVAGGIV